MHTVQVRVLVIITTVPPIVSNHGYREFDPAFHAVAKAWSTLPKEERDKHFFATADFADNEGVFRKVCTLITMPLLPNYNILPARTRIGPRRYLLPTHSWTQQTLKRKDRPVQLRLQQLVRLASQFTYYS